jgi:hypothetical protein
VPVSPASALGGGPSPTAKELWNSYPLTQQNEANPPQTAQQAPSAPPARPKPDRPAREHPAPASSDNGGGVPWVAVLAVLALALAVFLATVPRRVRRARRRAAHLPRRPHPTHDKAQAMTPNQDTEPTGNGAGRRPPMIVSPARPPAPEHAWVAEIVWEQHAEDPVFRAVAEREDSADRAIVATSRRVQWPPSGTTAVNDLRDAVDQLAATLVGAGWSARGSGRHWYARRFAWEPEPAQRPSAPDHTARSENGRTDVGPRPVLSSVQTAPWVAPAEVQEPRSVIAPPVTTPADFEQRWHCEIRWDSGYVNSCFVAMRFAPRARRGSAICASAPVRWMLKNDPDPQLSQDRAAVRELCEALVATGWEPAGRGHAWYAERFVWPGRGEPPDRLDPAVAAGMHDQARWRCEITWHDGVSKPRFVAVMSEKGRRRRLRIASSTPLKASALSDPDQAHHEAVARLEETLIEVGWEPVERVGPWFARRFVWRSDTPPPRDLKAAANKRPRATARPAKGGR